MSTEQSFHCREQACDSVFQGTGQELAAAGWFLPRGASARYAYCPAHLPAWVPEWRENKMRARSSAEAFRARTARHEQTNGALARPVRWQLALSWPTAWDVRGDFFKLAEAKAYELGGGTSGGGIMTGAPLYNSPSTLTAVFTAEESALTFVDWVKSYFTPRRHEDCDVRFYSLKLERIERYAIAY